jgi:hypothetical protein
MPARLSSHRPRACLLVLLALGIGACRPDALPGEFRSTNAVSAALTAGTESADGPEASVRVGDLVLAMVGDHTISIADVERRLRQFSPETQLFYGGQERRAGLVQLLLWRELLVLDAERRGYVATVDEDIARLYTRAWLYLQDPAATVLTDELDAAGLQALYEEFAPSFNRPEERLGALMVADTRERAEAFLTEYRAVLSRGRDTPQAIFDDVAARFTTDPDVIAAQRRFRWTRANAVEQGANPDLVAALFSSPDAGTIVGPIQTSRGWEVVQIASIREPTEVSLEDARPWLEERLRARMVAAAQRAALEALRATTPVTVPTDALARIDAHRGTPQTRPRLYDEATLAVEPSRVLGFELAEELANQPGGTPDPLLFVTTITPEPGVLPETP